MPQHGPVPHHFLTAHRWEQEPAYLLADQLKRCSGDYQIVEASDGKSGLDLFRSRRIDCVVLELSLPDQSGFQTLVDLVPIASRPQVAVIVFTLMTNRGVWEVAKQNGAYTCLAKEFTTGDDLDKAIQRAVAFVGQVNYSRQSTTTLTTSSERNSYSP